MKTINYQNNYALVPFSDFPFSGDFILVKDGTEDIIFDSRVDGYDIITDALITWVDLVRDPSVPEGAVYKFTVIDPSEMKGE